MKFLDGFFYLVSFETYESGKRIKVQRELDHWYKQKEPNEGYPKVRIEYGEGMFVIYRAIDKPIGKEPMLVCTQGFIDFV